MKGLKDKHVVITGATSGIGLATAKRFAAEGCRLCLIDLKANPDAIAGLDAHFIQANVADAKDLASIATYLQDNPPNILINNAGITRDAQLSKMTDDMWDDVIAVNLTAVFKLSRIAANLMKERGGAILNAASIVAHYGNFGQANYVAAKAGLIGMTKTLARELGRYNIRVNAVAPGFIGTPMVQTVPEKILDQVRAKTPLGRMGHPEEVAAAYAFLASEEASFITGVTLDVTGGLIA